MLIAREMCIWQITPESRISFVCDLPGGAVSVLIHCAMRRRFHDKLAHRRDMVAPKGPLYASLILTCDFITICYSVNTCNDFGDILSARTTVREMPVFCVAKTGPVWSNGKPRSPSKSFFDLKKFHICESRGRERRFRSIRTGRIDHGGRGRDPRAETGEWKISNFEINGETWEIEGFLKQRGTGNRVPDFRGYPFQHLKIKMKRNHETLEQTRK